MSEDLRKIDDITEYPRIGIFGLGIMEIGRAHV